MLFPVVGNRKYKPEVVIIQRKRYLMATSDVWSLCETYCRCFRISEVVPISTSGTQLHALSTPITPSVEEFHQPETDSGL